MTPIRIRTLAPLAVAMLASFASAVHAGEAPAMASHGVLVDAQGMTLYTFDQDPSGAGKSACNGPCATNWPPLMAGPADQDAGEWSVITRDDGSRQWAYKGKPLYLWIKDQKPGDRTGDGFKEVWHVAKP